MGRRKDEGWEPVDNSDGSITGPNHDGGSQVGTHDLILHRMPKDHHSEMKSIAGDISKQRVTGAMDFDGAEDDGKTNISFADDQ
jgi:hypothetical protein